MHILIMADLHGLVWDGLRVAVQVREEMEIEIDAVVVAGDLGYFPDLSRLDRATRKYGRKYPDELGYYAWFTKRDPQFEHWLSELDEPPPPIYFARGNHEDHEALAEHVLRAPGRSVDVYGLVHYLPDGDRTALRNGHDELKLVAVGGIESFNPNRGHPLRGIQEYAVDRVLDMPRGSADILVSHDPPRKLLQQFLGHSRLRDGSELIQIAVDWLKPRYCFSGHVHMPIPSARAGDTTCVGIGKMRKGRDQRCPSSGSVMLLRWDGPSSHELKEVPSEVFDGLRWAPRVHLQEEI